MLDAFKKIEFMTLMDSKRAWLEEGLLIDLHGRISGFMKEVLDSDKISLSFPSITNLGEKVIPKDPPPLEPALFLTHNIKDKITLSSNIKWSNTDPSTLMTAYTFYDFHFTRSDFY